MDFTKLRSFNKTFPLYVEKFELFGVDENSSITEKINSMVQALNKVGKLSNDVLKDWNKVMEWVMSEGLDESVDKKVEAMILSGKFDEILQTSLTEINGKVDGFQTQLTEINGKVDGVQIQLTESEKYENQIDYVDLLKRNMQFNSIQFKKRDATTKDFEVSLKYGDNRHISYMFSRNNVATADDYILQNLGYVGKSELVTNANYDSVTGTFTTTSPPNYYTTQVGATVTKAFVGTGIDFTFLADTRGGLWEFKIDNGDTVKVSTWSALSSYTKTVPLFRDLNFYGNHTVVGTFLGDDPAHVPSTGAGTSRGWLKYGDGVLSTFKIQNGVSVTTNEISILQDYSNKEFAWSLKKQGSTSTSQFFPTHGTPTAFNVVGESIYVDGKIIDLATTTNIEGAKSFKLVQVVNATHPDFPTTPLLQLTTIHNINLSGVVEVNCKANFLLDTFIENGYVGMFPIVSTFPKIMKSSIKNSYPTVLADGSRTDLTEEGENTTSYLFLTDANKNYGAGIRFNDVKTTLRQGKVDKYPSTVWLEHRSTGLQKLYPQVFKNSTMLAGSSFEFSCSYMLAEIPKLYDIV